MKKKLSLLLSALLALSLLAGCGQTAAESGGSQAETDTVTIVDHAGYEVTLPTDIQRIAVCDILPMPSVLSVFFDSADKIVAMSPTSMSAAENSLLSELYPEILHADTNAINGTEVNTEELMKLNPQVVFYGESSAQLGETLRKAGFNAVAISVNKWEYNAIETLNQWIDLLCQIFPESDQSRADLCRQYSEEALDLVAQRVAGLSDEERARVFFLFKYSDGTIMTSGRHFFGQWWADAVGAVNVSNELSEDNSVKVTLEQVYVWNPEVILMTNFTTYNPDDLYSNAVGSYDWSTMDAVMNQEVYKMPLGMYRSYTPGVDTPITLLWLAQTIYPELFADIDITEETIEYYETVFGVALTADQARSIFTPSAAGGAGF
ncbi:MAG: ABC transporter substrate-binding protein [Clostridium sp.]|nr:ABC transporter substrate-binding protein [Clostridium sp.]